MEQRKSEAKTARKVGLHCPKCSSGDVDVLEGVCRNCHWDIVFRDYVWVTRSEEYDQTGRKKQGYD